MALYYSDKHDTLTKGKNYKINGELRKYLGFTHIDGGREVQYRFLTHPTRLDYYDNKTARELDKCVVEE